MNSRMLLQLSQQKVDQGEDEEYKEITSAQDLHEYRLKMQQDFDKKLDSLEPSNKEP